MQHNNNNKLHHTQTYHQPSGNAVWSLSMSQRIWLSALLFMLISGGVLLFSGWQFDLAARASQAQQARIVEQQQALLDLQASDNQRAELARLHQQLLQVGDAWNTMLYWDFDAALTAQYESRDNAMAAEKQAKQGLAALRSAMPDVAAQFATLDEQHQQYRSLVDKAFQFFLKGSHSLGTSLAKGAREQAVAMSKGLQVLDTRLRQSIEQAAQSRQQRLETAERLGREVRDFSARMASDAASSQRLLMMIGVAVLLLSLINGAVFSRMLLRPVRRLQQVLVDTAKDRDLTRRSHSQRTDELGEMARAFDTLQLSMAETLGQVNSLLTELEDSAARSRGTSDQLQQLVAGQQQDLGDVMAQASLLNESASAVDEHSHVALGRAQEAEKDVAEGFRAVADSHQSMHRLADCIDSTGQAMATLAEHSNSIGGVLDVIRGISEQTNLLALNAAIEAARAGEQGRGFAVVADEVRELAQRASNSTDAIQQMVEQLQQEAVSAEAVVGRSRDLAAESRQLSDEARTALSSIQQAVQAMAQLNRDIAQVATQQQQQAANIEQSLQDSTERVEQVAREATGILQRGDELEGQLVRLRSGLDCFRC